MTDDRTRNEADQRTLMALMGLVLVTLMLLGLVALVLPMALGFVMVAGGMLLFGTAHYVVWGWWLPRILGRDDEGRSDRPE